MGTADSCVYAHQLLGSPFANSIRMCHNKAQDTVACGRCGNICQTNMWCTAGQCTCGRSDLPSSLTGCTYGTTTYCVDTGVNPTSCGTCFNTCGQDKVCIEGKCVCTGTSTACAWGPVVNNVQPTRCVDTSSDDYHCGGCWQRCGSFYKCIAGKCTPKCSTPYTLCKMPGVPTSS
jgi:hypothetical protein